MHRWLAEQIDNSHRNRGMKVNCIGPRGGAKSTVGTVAHVLRAAVESWEPLIWIISETEGQAENQLEKIKSELESNLTLKAAYPDAFGKGPTWQSSAIKLRNGVVIELTAGPGYSRPWRTENRPTLIIFDDLQSDPVMTSGDRRKNWEWFTSAPLKAGSKRTNFFNHGTALHGKQSA